MFCSVIHNHRTSDARLITALAPRARDFLAALLCSSVGTPMDNWSLRLAATLGLGLPVSTEYKRICDVIADALSCNKANVPILIWCSFSKLQYSSVMRNACVVDSVPHTARWDKLFYGFVLIHVLFFLSIKVWYYYLAILLYIETRAYGIFLVLDVWTSCWGTDYTAQHGSCWIQICRPRNGPLPDELSETWCANHDASLGKSSVGDSYGYR